MVGSWPYPKRYTSLENLPCNKDSSLSQTFENYVCKTFVTFGPSVNVTIFYRGNSAISKVVCLSLAILKLQVF
jgi:hypothetical protein